MEWMNSGLFGLLGILLGAGGICYAVIMHYVEKKKYDAALPWGEFSAEAIEALRSRGMEIHFHQIAV